MKTKTLLAAGMAIILATGAAIASLPLQANAADPLPGENGYVSLHKYVSPTSNAGEYRITLEVMGKIENDPPVVDVVVYLDQSGSMTSGSPSAEQKAHDALDAMLDVLWDPTVLAPMDAEPEWFRIGIIGFGNGIENETSSSTVIGGVNPTTLTGANGGMIPYHTNNKTSLSTWINALASPGGTTLMPAAATQSLTSGLYFKAATSSSWKDADNRFVVIIADGDSGNTIQTLSAERNSGYLTNVFALAVNGSGFTHNSATVPNKVSDWDPSNGTYGSMAALYNVPQTTAGQEQALINLATVFPAGTYPTTYSASTLSAANAVLDPTYRSTATGYNYYYANTAAIATAAFQAVAHDIVEQATPPASGAKVTDKVTDEFTLTKFSGQPMFELTASDGSDPGTVSNAGNVLSWNLPNTLVSGVTYRLSYYVKVVDGLDPNKYYATNDYAYISYQFNGIDYKFDFAKPYVNPSSGETKVEDTTAGSRASAISKTTGSGTKSNEGSGVLPLLGSVGTLKSRALPKVTGLRSSTLKNGRTQVTCEVENGTDFYYQWQYQDSDKKWIDIPGANSSVYTLGAPLKIGQSYKIRCVVMNSVGTKVTSDTIEVKRTKAGVGGESLQQSVKTK